MPRAKTKRDYAVRREDGSYLTYTLTDSDYKTLTRAVVCGDPFAVLTVGVIGLQGRNPVMEVIMLKPEPKEKKEKPANPPMTQLEAWYARGGIGDQPAEDELEDPYLEVN